MTSFCFLGGDMIVLFKPDGSVSLILVVDGKIPASEETDEDHVFISIVRKKNYSGH